MSSRLLDKMLTDSIAVSALWHLQGQVADVLLSRRQDALTKKQAGRVSHFEGWTTVNMDHVQGS